MQRRSTGGAAVVVIALAVLSGCGGSSSSGSSASSSATTTTSQTSDQAAQFKSGIGPVLNEFQAASHATGLELERASSQTDAQVQAAFRLVAARWQAAITRLESLTPTGSVSADFDRLKGEVAKVAADLDAIVGVAQRHDAGAAKRASQKLVNDILSAKSTATTITQRLGIK